MYHTRCTSSNGNLIRPLFLFLFWITGEVLTILIVFLVGPTQHPEETWNQTVINFLISPINRCRTLWDVLKVIFQQYSTVFSIRPPKQLSFPNISTRFIVLKQYSTSLARQHYNECWKCRSMESLGLYTTLPSAHPQCAAWTTVHLWKRCWCNSGWMRSPCHFEHLL